MQVLLLAATLAALAATLFRSELLALPLLFAALALVQVGLLIHSVQRHVDTLEDFFAAINYEDFTRRFVEDDVDGELRQAFNRILGRFQDARAERDLQAGYLDTVVRHVPVPFFAARADGSLSLSNNPARRLTGLPALRHMKDLAALDPQLPEALATIPAGQQRLLRSRLRDVPVELRVAVAEIRLEGQVERLYSVENLSGELTARESAAWRDLIRVLTHEIMNTLTPVTSLAKTTEALLDDPTATEDIRQAVQTIGRRSDGLMRFVAHYRELLKVPEPELAMVSLRPLLDGVLRLQATALASTTVSCEVQPDTLSVNADARLIEQVLINLLRNALEAMVHSISPELRLTAHMDFGRTVVTLEDNGCGIDPQTLEQVFIPFFTTKREGSGIGLSISRQIMTAHGGELVLEPLRSGTRAKLIFR